MNGPKYNAWDTMNKIMYDASELGKDELTINPDGRGFVNVSGVSQSMSEYCTHIIPLKRLGLCDKNNKEIAEGHIVKNPGGGVYQVKYKTSAAAFELIPIVARYPLYFHEFDVSECEVIGNIYQNPELMK